MQYRYIYYIDTHSLPHVREQYRTVLDSGFHAVDSRFQVLDSSLSHVNLDSGFQLLLGFRIPIAVFPIPKLRIPDSISKISWDSGFRNRAESLSLSLRALVLLNVNFWAHCRNFRCTAENFRSTAYNVWSIYFKRKCKKLLRAKVRKNRPKS